MEGRRHRVRTGLPGRRLDRIGGPITTTGFSSPQLATLATQLLEERVKPRIVEQYGTGLANTAWVTLRLRNITTTAPVPPGTNPEGEPVVSGAEPGIAAQWTNGGLQLVVPELIIDSRVPIHSSTSVTWLLRDGGSVAPATISQFAGPLTLNIELTIGVKFFGSDLVGGMSAPFTCVPESNAVAQTQVLAASTTATAIFTQPHFTG